MEAGTCTLTILAADSESKEKISYDIGKLTLDLPIKAQEGDVFHPLEEIEHVFRPDTNEPNSMLSYSFVLLTLSPWIFLVGTVSAFLV